MSMFTPAINDTDQRIDALKAALIAAGTGRVIQRGYTHYSTQPEADLRTGIINMVTTNEGDYATGRGMGGLEGITRVALIGQLRVEEKDTTEVLEKAELAFIQQIKDFSRLPQPGLNVRLVGWEKSQLIEHPYGWFVASVELGPPRANTN